MNDYECCGTRTTVEYFSYPGHYPPFDLHCLECGKISRVEVDTCTLKEPEVIRQPRVKKTDEIIYSIIKKQTNNKNVKNKKSQ